MPGCAPGGGVGSGGLTFETARKAGLFVIFWAIHLYQQLYAAFVAHCVKLCFAHSGVGVNVFLPERKAAGLFVVGGAAGDGGADGGHELVAVMVLIGMASKMETSVQVWAVAIFRQRKNSLIDGC